MSTLTNEQFEATYGDFVRSHNTGEFRDVEYKGRRVRLWTDIRLTDNTSLAELPLFMERAARKCDGNVSIYRPDIGDPLAIRIRATEYWISEGASKADLSYTIMNWQNYVRHVKSLAAEIGWS